MAIPIAGMSPSHDGEMCRLSAEQDCRVLDQGTKHEKNASQHPSFNGSQTWRKIASISK